MNKVSDQPAASRVRTSREARSAIQRKWLPCEKLSRLGLNPPLPPSRFARPCLPPARAYRIPCSHVPVPQALPPSLPLRHPSSALSLISHARTLARLHARLARTLACSPARMSIVFVWHAHLVRRPLLRVAQPLIGRGAEHGGITSPNLTLTPQQSARSSV